MHAATITRTPARPCAAHPPIDPRATLVPSAVDHRYSLAHHRHTFPGPSPCHARASPRGGGGAGVALFYFHCVRNEQGRRFLCKIANKVIAGVISPSSSGSSSGRKYSRGHFRGGRRGFAALDNTGDASDSPATATTSSATGSIGIQETASHKLTVHRDPNRPNGNVNDDDDGDDDALLSDMGDIGGASALLNSVQDTLLIGDHDGESRESAFAQGGGKSTKHAWGERAMCQCDSRSLAHIHSRHCGTLGWGRGAACCGTAWCMRGELIRCGVQKLPFF